MAGSFVEVDALIRWRRRDRSRGRGHVRSRRINFWFVQDRSLRGHRVSILCLPSTTCTRIACAAICGAGVIAVANPQQARSAGAALGTNVVAKAVARITFRRIVEPLAPVHLFRAAGRAGDAVSQSLANFGEWESWETDVEVWPARVAAWRRTSAAIATNLSAVSARASSGGRQVVEVT